MQVRVMLIAAGAAAAMGGVSQAALSPASPIVIDQASSVKVEFVSQSAGATGSLYFLGWEPAGGGPVSYVMNSDAAGLGMHLMSNHATPVGQSVVLGTFDPGRLHFAYLVTAGVNVAPTGSLFRSDVAADQVYFASDQLAEAPARVYTYGIEDIRDPAQSDWDYNDMIVQITATPVPSPGAAGLGLASAMLIGGRRRRVS